MPDDTPLRLKALPPLARAFLFSLAAHGVLLLPAASFWFEAPVWSAAPLRAQLAARIVPAPSQPALSGLPALADRPPPAAPPRRKIIAQPPERAGAPAQARSLSGAPPPPRPEGRPSGAAPASLMVEAAQPGVAGATVDADDLRQYRMALAIEARRFRRYPALARERGWEGVAEVGVTLDLQGAPQVLLHVSSGHVLLDEAALEMLRQSVRAVPVSAALRGREIRLLLPVRFSLED